jgi:hypothetical protein
MRVLWYVCFVNRPRKINRKERPSKTNEKILFLRAICNLSPVPARRKIVTKNNPDITTKTDTDCFIDKNAFLLFHDSCHSSHPNDARADREKLKSTMILDAALVDRTGTLSQYKAQDIGEGVASNSATAAGIPKYNNDSRFLLKKAETANTSEITPI